MANRRASDTSVPNVRRPRRVRTTQRQVFERRRTGGLARLHVRLAGRLAAGEHLGTGAKVSSPSENGRPGAELGGGAKQLDWDARVPVPGVDEFEEQRLAAWVRRISWHNHS